jgi:hypothetical protein
MVGVIFIGEFSVAIINNT